jgi:hypothetical protein
VLTVFELGRGFLFPLPLPFPSLVVPLFLACTSVLVVFVLVLFPIFSPQVEVHSCFGNLSFSRLLRLPSHSFLSIALCLVLLGFRVCGSLALLLCLPVLLFLGLVSVGVCCFSSFFFLRLSAC